MDREFGWNDEITEEGGNYEPLPEGNYDFTIAKVERARSQGKGKLPPCNMAKVTFDVWGADDKREITVNFVLHSSLEWKLSQLFLSVSMKNTANRSAWTGQALSARKVNVRLSSANMSRMTAQRA